LQKTDALQAAVKARAQAAAQKQVEASQKEMLAVASKLNPSTGVVYGPMQQQGAQEDYQKMEAIATNPKLSRAERNFQIQQIVDARNRNGEAGKANDKFISGEIQNAVTDKRLNSSVVAKKLHDTVYRRNEDGSLLLDANDKPQVIPPMEYDTQSTAAALAQGNDHISTPVLFSQFVDTLPDDSATFAQQPLPGHTGVRRVVKSNVFEINDNGTYKLDTKTGKRVIKNTPEMLAAFQSDPLQKQWLDAEDAKHEKKLAGIIDKMKANEPLTEEEQHTVAVEQSVEGRKMELVKRGLLQYGYGRSETDLLAKAAPRPPASRLPKAPTNIVSNSTEFLPGAVLGGRGSNGTPGIVSYGMMPAVTYGKPGEEAKKYRARVKHKELVTQRDDGSSASVNTANQTVEELEYGARHLLLRGKNGTVFFPPKAALLAAEQGDFGPSEAFARQLRTTHPDVKPEWYVEATPVGKSVLPRPHIDPNSGQATDKERRTPTVTHYVRWSGQDKIDIDKATGYAFRDKKVADAMAKRLAETEARTRPQAASSTSAGSFYQPKPPKASKTPTLKATPPNTLTPAAKDPYSL
jgi:hypothetical protein